MRRRIATLVLAALAASLLPTLAASGGIRDVPIETLEVARGFGFNDPQIDIIASHAWDISEQTQSYGYADDPFGAPGLTGEAARGTMPLFIGMEHIRYTDASLLPESFDGPTLVGEDLFVPFGTGGIQLGVEYTWFWVEFDEDIPIDNPEIGINIAFPFYVPGYDRYTNDDFGGDSWQTASHVPFVYSDRTGPDGALEWFAGLFTSDEQYVPDEGLSGGLAWFCGSSLGILIPTDAYRQTPEQRVTEYGFAGDFTLGAEYRFDPAAPRAVRVFPAFGEGGRDMLAGIDDPERLTLNLGYEPLVDFSRVRVFYDEDEQLWANIRSLLPWPVVAAIDRLLGQFFSIGAQWGLDVDGVIDLFFGLEGHDGDFTLFGSTPDGEAMPDGVQVMNDGSLNVSLGLEWSAVRDAESLKLRIGSAFWRDEETTERQSVGFAFDIAPDAIMQEDPNGDGVRFYPTFDFVTGEEVDPPPTAATTTMATTSRDEPTTTTIGSATPGTSIGDDGEGFGFWLGWVLVALLAAYLIAPIFTRFGEEPWWSCWIAWFILIFAWAPFLIVGLDLHQPSWWRLPLLLWFPFIGGYTWAWAREQDWWQPRMLPVSAGYLAVLAAVLVFADSPDWEVLLPVFWLPLVAYYLWRRGVHRPWWRQEMYGVFGLFAAFVLLWPAALSAEWAWWLPVALGGTIGWWFTSRSLEWSTLRDPKWSWSVGFTLVPFLAWGIPLWDPWWTGGIAVVAALIAALSYRDLYLEPSM